MDVHERLLLLDDVGGVGVAGGVVDQLHCAVGEGQAVADAGGGGDEVEVKFPLKTLGDDLHVEQTEEAAVTEPTEPSDTSSTPAATTIRTAATEATSSEINYGQLYAEPESPVMLIVIIVGVAVVIVVGAIIGYMIYRKKKFY